MIWVLIIILGVSIIMNSLCIIALQKRVYGKNYSNRVHEDVVN